MGLKQESESARAIKYGYAKKCRSKRGRVSSYKPIVETRNPPVTVLEQFSPEHACEFLADVYEERGSQGVCELLGLEMGSPSKLLDYIQKRKAN